MHAQNIKNIIDSGLLHFDNSGIIENLRKINQLLQVFYDNSATQSTTDMWENRGNSPIICVKILLLAMIADIEKQNKKAKEVPAGVKVLQNCIKITEILKTLI